MNQLEGAGTEAKQSNDSGQGRVSRRAILAGLGLGTIGVAGGIALLGDDDRSTVPDDIRTETAENAFDGFEQLRTAVRASPDHLPMRAAEAVESGDPETILAVVRDNVLVHPTDPDDFQNIEDRGKWGPQATLRGGAGTARDVVDALAMLYREAGFEAEIVGVRPKLDRRGVERILFKTLERTFKPDISREAAARLDALTGDNEAEFKQLDPEGKQSRALATRLFEAAPSDAFDPEPFDFSWRHYDVLPTVRVRVDGQWRYANPLDPTATLDDPKYPIDSSEPIDPNPSRQDVRVTLSAAFPDDPRDRQELVSGTWSAMEVAGRQLSVAMHPGIDPFEVPGVRVADVQTFIPSLAVQDPSASREELEALSVVGEAVTRSGDVLSVAEDGSVERDGRVLTDGDTSAAVQVESLAVTVDPSRYPDVRLTVDAKDAAGASVEGLPAAAFEVVDEEPSGIALVAAQSAPRIRLLIDQSASIPEIYREEGGERLVEQLTAAIADADPAASVTMEETGSDIYTSLAEAAESENNVVVYITDGEANESPNEELEAAIAAGPPAVMLNVFDAESESMRELAELTGGEYAVVSDRETVVQTVVEYVRRIGVELPAYVFEYVALGDSDPGDRRTVTVHVPEAELSEAASYTVPEGRMLPSHFAGLYLTVETADREVTRTLGGWDPVRHRNDLVTDDHLSDVESVLFGKHLLSFEAGAPSPSVWLDDILTAKLSVRSTYETARDEGGVAASEVLREGIAVVPAALSILQAPLPNESTADSLTFQDALRVVLMSEKPDFETGAVLTGADVLALTKYHTATEDPQRAVRLTGERTARISIAEAALYEESAEALLVDQSLSIHDRRTNVETPTAERNHRLVESRPRDEFALVPDYETDPFAFWAIDHETGAILGVLSDGSGGARTRQEDILDRLGRAVSLINLLALGAAKAGLVTGPGLFWIGAVTLYGQTLTRLYGAATLALITMDNDQRDEEFRNAILSAVCSIAKDIAFSSVKSAKFTVQFFVDITPWIENILGSVGGPSLCPF
ncbi:hypothetical protein ACFQE1_05410 [Halobium palmae]|uniref:von Willebrand factor type A domain-containing protein n=1 Tax=Halobium palmae TaxID=1776492 RepID=A0ABD5RXR9_9EURY